MAGKKAEAAAVAAASLEVKIQSSVQLDHTYESCLVCRKRDGGSIFQNIDTLTQTDSRLLSWWAWQAGKLLEG